jgi:hypothetical protein
MILLSLLALTAWHDDRTGRAALLYALALASKETAAPLILLFAAHDRLLGKRAWQESLLRLAPSLLFALVWVFVHPMMLGRLWAGAPTPTPPSPAAVAPWVTVWRSLLSVFSLDLWPQPDGGWRAVWWDGLRGALILMAFVELLARPDERPSNTLTGGRTRPTRGAMPFAWAWLGLRHAAAAAAGARLARLRRALRRARSVAGRGPCVRAVPGRGDGAHRGARLPRCRPCRDAVAGLGEAAYQRRAGGFVSGIKEQLLGADPRMEANARLWFVRLPNNVGFLAGMGRSCACGIATARCRRATSARTPRVPPERRRGRITSSAWMTSVASRR